MFPSLVLALVFTVVFAVTGAYALVRLALIFSGVPSGGDRLAELSHLLMSLAMIGMAWGLGVSGPAPALQIGVFAGFALWFLARAALPALDREHGRLANVLHALVAAAMVWMVAAMPVLMGVSTAAGGSGHAGHGGGAATSAVVVDGPDAPAAPAAAVGATVVFVGVLVVGAVVWAARAVRGLLVVRPVPVLVGAGSDTEPVRPGMAALTGARQDAVCHLLMSLGMAGMLVAML